MFPIWASAMFTIIILLISTTILALCLAIWAILLYRMWLNFWSRYWKTIPGTIVAIVVFGSFALVFGIGAYNVSSMVIDGMIARIAATF